MNDLFTLHSNSGFQPENDGALDPTPVENAPQVGIEYRHRGAAYEEAIPISHPLRLCQHERCDMVASREGSRPQSLRRCTGAGTAGSDGGCQAAGRIRQPSDVWELKQYLTQRRKEIDRKYQFRASHLTQVLGRLLHEKRISERELRGLHEDKLNSVRSFAKFLTESVA